MSIERLTPDDMSWTNHSIHAHQYHMQNMYHYHDTSMHNYNCPLDPCRSTSLKGSLLPLRPLSDDETVRRRDGEAKALKERREREEQERRERDRLIIEERERRAQRERIEGKTPSQDSQRPQPSTHPATPAPTSVSHSDTHMPDHYNPHDSYLDEHHRRSEYLYQRPSESTYTPRDLYDDTARSARRSASDAQTAAQLAYREVGDAINMSGVSDFLNKGNAISRQFTAPQHTLVAQTATAAYALVATVATHNLAAYRADIYDREREEFVSDMHRVAEGKMPAAAVVDKETSFATYQNSVAESRGYERTAITTLEQNRDRQIEAAQSVKDGAEQKYKSDVSVIEHERQREQRTYDAKLQGLNDQISGIQNANGIERIRQEKQEKIDNAQAVYNAGRNEILSKQAAEIATVDRSTPIAAAQIREIEAKYAPSLQTLSAQHQKEINHIEKTYTERESSKAAKYDKNLSDLMEQRTQLMDAHKQASRVFDERITGAKTERDATFQKCEQTISRARSEFAEQAKDIAPHVSTRAEEVAQKKTLSDRIAARIDAALHGDKIMKEQNEAAYNLRTVLVAQQGQLSENIASLFGTQEEKQLLTAYFDDKAKEQSSAQSGVPYVSALSDKDKAEVEKILHKYGNTNCKSTNDIEGAVTKMQSTLPRLETLVQQNATALQNATQRVENLQNKQKSLLDKVGGDATKLSKTDKKALAKTAEDLAKALATQKSAQGKLANAQGTLTLLQSQAAMLTKHKQILPQLGTKDREKFAAQQKKKSYKQATKKVERTLTSAIGKLNAATGVYNDAYSRSEAKFRRQINEVGRSLSFAASTVVRTAQVSIIATKMIYRGGSVLVKGAHVWLSQSPHYRKTVDKFLAQAAKHPRMMGFLKGAKGAASKVVNSKGAAMLGKAALKAPKAIGTTVAVVASLATFDLQEMEKAMWKGTGKLAMKGVRHTTKAATKAINKRYGAQITRLKQRGLDKIRLGKQQLKKGVKMVGKRATSAITSRLAKTKAGRAVLRAGNALKRGLGRIGQALGKVGKALMAPFKALASAAGKLLSLISSGLSAAAGAVVSAVTSLLTFLMQLLFWLALFILLVTLILAAIDAILAIFGDPASEAIKLTNDPSFIMNMGSNYRNVEISIAEFFSEESGWTSNDAYKHKVECNDDPLYYAVFNNSFDWFGLADDGKDINECSGECDHPAGGNYHVNQDAFDAYKDHYAHLANLQNQGLVKNLQEGKKFWETLATWVREMYSALKNFFAEFLNPGEYGTFGDVWEKEFSAAVKNVDEQRFRSLVTTYDKVSATYFTGVPDNAIKSPNNVEVSNAKDAMAMMDAIYTMDPDMTKTKVLRYLGVGEYTISGHEVPKKALKVSQDASGAEWDMKDNLFWDTHAIRYASGTSCEGIVFHPQQSAVFTGGDPTKVSAITGTLSADHPGYGILTKECNNYSTLALSYTLQEHADGECGEWKKHTSSGVMSYDDGTWTDLEFHSGAVYFYTDWSRTVEYETVYGADGSSKTYISKQTVTCGYNHYRGGGVYRPCRWTIYGEIPSGFTITYYKDHWLYGNAIKRGTYTTSWEWKPNNPCPHTEEKHEEFQYCLGHTALKANIYVVVGDPDSADQPTIYDVASSMGERNYNIGGLWTWSKDLNIRAWGSTSEFIDPGEEWTDDALIGLAKGKIVEPLEYFGDPEAETGGNNGFSPMKTKHGEESNNQVLIWFDSDMLLYHALYFKNHIFYQADFVSGRQANIEVFLDGPGVNKDKISFIGAPNGVTYVLIE